MSAAAGRHFGPYETIGLIGAGGMGEVFKARDTRLDRIVAVKTSRDEFSDRFAREARTVAALNHPHIAALYDVGPDYLVMEYVEGETLRGPLPLPRALLYAGQILEALDAAHRRGVVHRDLKPANIMVAKSGVKLLDFGLAQMKQGGPLGDQTQTMAISAEGSIAGTLNYMSPEQLQGKPADARSDIFAFGLVFYEMLTGRRAFDADNAASVISAIMTAEPPALDELKPVTPPALERILKQCLAKDPDERWQSAADIRRAFELLETVPAGATPARAPRARWWWAAAAFALGALISGVALRLAPPKPPPPWTFRPITYSGRAHRPVLSPDGKQVAFIWSGEKDREFDLYVQLVSGGNPLRLPEAHPGGRPAWSPDGSRLAVLRPDGLYVMPALGGTPRRLAAFENSGALDLAWSADGTFFVLAGHAPGLTWISAEGGEPREVTKPAPADDYFPAISPDGRTVAFVRRTSTYNAQLMVLPLNGQGAAGEPRQITTGVWDISSLDWTADGREVLFEGSKGSGNASLWRVAKSGGTPVRFNTPSAISGEPTVAPQAGRMVYVSGHSETKIFKVPLGTRAPETPLPLVDALGNHSDLSVSPDGSHIAFTGSRTGSKEIWIANADGSNQTQLTSFNGPAVGSPRWSPDGKRIAFDGYASGSSDLYVIAIEGGNPARLTSDKGNEIRPSWSHDGQWIYFGWDRGPGHQIWKIRPSGGEPVQVTRTAGYEAFEAPDGSWLYVLAPPNLTRMRPDGSEETKLRDDITPNFWTVGGRAVYVLEPKNRDLLRAPFTGTIFETVFRFPQGLRPEGGGTCIGVPHDESYVIYRRGTRTLSTLMLIEGFR